MRYELSDFEWTQYLESQIGIAAHPSRRPLRGLLRMRSSLLKHNNLMLRSERRERREAWAASDSPISHSRCWRTLSTFNLPSAPQVQPASIETVAAAEKSIAAARRGVRNGSRMVASN